MTHLYISHVALWGTAYKLIEQKIAHYRAFFQAHPQVFPYLSEGYSRCAYMWGDYVVKLALDTNGVNCNHVEQAIWQHAQGNDGWYTPKKVMWYKENDGSHRIQVLPCRVVDTVLLIMPKVRVMGTRAGYCMLTAHESPCDVPMWAYNVDGSQVGEWNGSVRCFDFGEESPPDSYVHPLSGDPSHLIAQLKAA